MPHYAGIRLRHPPPPVHVSRIQLWLLSQLNFHSQMQTESSSKFRLCKRIKSKIKRSCNNEKINKIDTALTRVWLCPVKTALHVPVRSEWFLMAIQGLSSLKSPDQIGSLLPVRRRESFPYEQTIDWQVHIGWIINFHASLWIKPPPGVKALAILHWELPNDRRWKLWLAKDKGFSFCRISQ